MFLVKTSLYKVGTMLRHQYILEHFVIAPLSKTLRLEPGTDKTETMLVMARALGAIFSEDKNNNKPCGTAALRSSLV